MIKSITSVLPSSANTVYALLFLMILLIQPAQAQTDTSAYEVQRSKINRLLEARSARFGQYDQSLKQRTGIFGLKTKKDMQRSIDILTQIVLNDNEIFAETKVLLDYKNYQQKEVESKVQTVEGRIDRYQTTIRNLQVQNEQLKDQIDQAEKRNDRIILYVVWLLIVLIGVLFWPMLRKLLKPDRPTMQN